MKDTIAFINDYLHYGYIPSSGSEDENFKELFYIHQNSQDDFEYEDFVNKGVAVLKNVFDDLVQGKENENHLVPLSGGLDSRLILAALLERIDPSNIQISTFGTPGSFDYEIPKLIAAKTKVKHIMINCTSIDFSMDNLVSACLDAGRWTSVPDNYINRLVFKTAENSCKWSGFMGGEIAGDYSGLYREDDNNYEVFAKYQKRVKNTELNPENYSAELALKKVKKSVNSLNEFELIFYNNRSLAGGKPIIGADNKDVIIPFIHPEWVSFISNVPQDYRRDSKLFRSIFSRMYPEMSKIPCKNNAGLSLGRNSKFRLLMNHSKLKARFELVKILNSVHYPPVGVNYLYYKEAIKVLPTFKKSLKDACGSLEDRGIVSWISPLSILETHLAGKEDYSQALLVLLGLEVNLRAEEKEPSITIFENKGVL